MFNFIKRFFRWGRPARAGEFGTGALRVKKQDPRNLQYGPIAAASAPVDWEKGYDIEEEIGAKIIFKNQGVSSSCVGQGWAYYVAVLDAIENGTYDEVSAKAIYSQIFLGGGGAYIMDGAKLIVNWGSLRERMIPSYNSGDAPGETFMRDSTWKTPQADRLAKILQAKEYRTFGASDNMELFAQAIRDNYGVVGGLEGTNNGTWSTNEPIVPTGMPDWAHCIYYGKFGIDGHGKWISIPNSWGIRGTDTLHPDGWQKLRQAWFDSNYMFDPWTLTDKPNQVVSEEIKKIMADNEKKIIMEGEGAGRKGVIVNGELREIKDPSNNRSAAACLYVLTNNGFGTTVSSLLFNGMKKGADF